MGILLLGLGNTIMSDDGMGCLAVDRLQENYRFPSEVTLLEGGTLGLDLLPHLEGIDRLLIIDALDMRATPGSVFRLEGEEVPRAFASKLSVHQMGVQDLLAVAELQGHLPSELVVWGIQPESIEVGTELTRPVKDALEQLLAGVLDDLARWGIVPKAAA